MSQPAFHGEVVYLYAFDVANEIAVGKIVEILDTRPFPFEIRTRHTFPKDVPLYKPLAIVPPDAGLRLAGREIKTLVRIYEVGVVSITFRVAFECGNLPELIPLHHPQLDGGQTLDAAASTLCAQVCAGLIGMLEDPSGPSEPEAYTVFCLDRLGEARDTGAWLEARRRDVAELLTETTAHRLSEMQVAEVLRITRSFTDSDLVVIDWDAALAVDLDGYVDDVLYMLELANLQLEEYRVMGQQLDHYLDSAYHDLKRMRFALLGNGVRTLNALRVFRVDVTKLSDDVTHISKMVGDWHLARIYIGACERFYLNQWRQSVEGRLSQLDDLYSVVNADINNRRMVVLELLIVLFFMIDLIMLAFKH